MKKERMKVFFALLSVWILLFNVFSVGIYAQEDTDNSADNAVADAITCSSLGGTCCSVCAGGSYLGPVSDCSNCCGTCQEETGDEYKQEYEKDYYKEYEAYEGSIEYEVSPGLTPDSPFYFVDNFVEGVFIGDNPDRALAYKEEKIAEAVVMVENNMPEEAIAVLEKATEYNSILEEEVTPELESRIDENSIRIQYVLKEIEADKGTIVDLVEVTGEPEFSDETTETSNELVEILKESGQGEIEVKLEVVKENGVVEVRGEEIIGTLTEEQQEIFDELKEQVIADVEVSEDEEVEIEIEIKEGEKEWEDVVDEVGENFDKEAKIRKAAEIAAKINELCMELAMLDPVQYEDTCKTGEDAPNWMKKIDKKLTNEQEKEAKEFGKIMAECFASSGKNCRCGDIPFYEFSVFCEKASSLAQECDAGTETACKQMDSFMSEMPELPGYLMDVFSDVERQFGESQFEKFMPPECAEAKATPKECMLIMIEINAPAECRAALKEAAEKGEIKGEKDGRMICDKIMFESHAPQECIDAGATTPEECEKIMFKQQMPEECIKAGFTGEYESDMKECKEMMRVGTHYGGSGCAGIMDPFEKSKCLEGAMNTMNIRYGMNVPMAQLTWQCRENRIHDAADCDRFMRDVWPEIEKQNQMKIDVMWQERQQYINYVQPGTPGMMKCPDRICDDWEKNNFGCPQDCGTTGYRDCGYGCWWEVDHCQCPGTTGQMDCGYGCWFDSSTNSCRCSTTNVVNQNCGYNCWWNNNIQACECRAVVDTGYHDCGYGCWWEPSSNSCRCSTTPTNCGYGCWFDSSLNRCECGTGVHDCGANCWWEVDHCQCPSTGQCGYGCWWQTDHCECGTGCTCPDGFWSSNCDCAGHQAGAGCTCPDGYYSYNCDCAGHQGNGCSCADGYYAYDCNCVGHTTSGYCGDGRCMVPETQTSCPSDCTGTTTSCPTNAFTTQPSACNTAYCPNGCTFSNGCPVGCYSVAGYCGNNVCDPSETGASCPTDCGAIICPANSYTTSGSACNIATCPSGCTYTSGCPSGCSTSGVVTCASKGGVCCTACSSAGPYIPGTDCNCCGSCQAACAVNSYTTSGGACNIATCPSGCTYTNGCPSGCSSTPTGYCGNGICDSSETGASCPSDCATSTCPTNSYTTNGACNTATCPSGCTYTSGCPSGCSSTAPTPCTCPDGYYSANCDCAAHQAATGCQCSCGWDPACNCASFCPTTPPPVVTGCQCSCGWDPNCNCASFCPTPPPTGGVIKAISNTGSWIADLFKSIFG